jgi:hypothetical protein
MSRYGISFVASMLLILGLASSSYGAFIGGELVNFKPDPVSTTLDEIGWTGTQLVQRPGSVGNNDGTLPADQQTPGGLNIQTPLKIVDGLGNPYPGSTINTSDSSTTFFDVTLQVSGLSAVGNPVKVGGLVYQWLGSGTFTFLSTGVSPQTLLTGSIDDAVIVGLQGQTAGSIQSSTVTYTGGLIKDALLATGGTLTDASLSWSILDIGGGLKVVGTGSLAALQLFGADMTGQFNALPEPATLCLMGLGAVVVLVRRWKR